MRAQHDADPADLAELAETQELLAALQEQARRPLTGAALGGVRELETFALERIDAVRRRVQAARRSCSNVTPLYRAGGNAA